LPDHFLDVASINSAEAGFPTHLENAAIELLRNLRGHLQLPALRGPSQRPPDLFSISNPPRPAPFAIVTAPVLVMRHCTS
jgi:hypothetical protein